MSVHSTDALSLPVGPGIVTAWFVSVLNPLITGLENESHLLARRNFTWREHSGQMLGIVQVRAHLDRQRWDNFDLFLTFFPHVAERCKTHDEQVSELGHACRDLFESLITDREFRALIQRALGSDRLALASGQTKEMFAQKYAPGDAERYAAEHIVNGTGQLGGEYGIAPLWNAFRADFLALRTQNAVQANWTAVEQKAEELAATVNLLLSGLRDARTTLALKYDIPPNP